MKFKYNIIRRRGIFTGYYEWELHREAESRPRGRQAIATGRTRTYWGARLEINRAAQDADGNEKRWSGEFELC